ncbi:MAG: hypothetical protein HY851_02495 [candidate division Zixibacteria bacterium]|nr:hypothetical protein [candidate division Zixibacteria bacterium]
MAGLGLPFGPAVHAQTFGLPDVTINNVASSFQAGLYPDYYRENSISADMRWLTNNDSVIEKFWLTQGDSVLSKLAHMGGINWVEPSFPIYLVKYYPSAGVSDPLVIPLGGLMKGVTVEAPPDSAGLLFNLIYQLSGRLLVQARLSDTANSPAIARHPLFGPGPFRRDNLAMLLTLATAPSFIGADATLASYNSPFWRARTPGRQVLEELFQKRWMITPQKPLAQWLIEEPYDSPLVESTRTPSFATDSTTLVVSSMAGLPPAGTLGFTVKSIGGRFEIDKIDPARLAYACGLRTGDAISQVDARRASTVKDLFERMLTGLDKGGSTLTLFRAGKTVTLLLRRS